MTLNQFAAERRLTLFDELGKGLDPSQGSFDRDLLKEARTKEHPQMGITRYSPAEISLEFIYPDPYGAATIFTVTLAAPERIVYMPVPSWVVENIWQGDITGVFHFESEALRLMDDLSAELSAEANRKWFDRQPAKRRE